MERFNYHSHSTCCDGKSSLEEMALSAIDKGLKYFGFSAHAPVPFDNHFALPQKDIQYYINETHRLKDKYKDKIKLFTSMEFDFITDIMENNREQAKEYGLDYFISSVHEVKEHNKSKDMWFIDGHDPKIYDDGLREIFDNDIQRAVTRFYVQEQEMIIKNRPDVIGHFDKVRMHNKNRFFTDDDPWYEEIVRSTIDIMKKYDTICEINTRGLYKKRSDDFYPDKKWIKVLFEKNIPITISTDCHNSDEVVMFFDEALNTVKQIGYKDICYFDNGWKKMKID
jgi:histidinol-phosphatase (PHP family)